MIHNPIFPTIQAEEDPSKSLFPLLAVCRFQNNIKTMVERKHLCTLPLNMYNGPVFAFNFLILSILLVSMVISIALWSVRLFLPSVRDDLVRKALQEQFPNHQHLERVTDE